MAKKRQRDALGRFLGKRAIAARAGWETRRRAERAARDAIRLRARSLEHGRKAREKTEQRLAPAAKARRTRDAARIERQAAAQKRSDAARKGWASRRGKKSRPLSRRTAAVGAAAETDEPSTRSTSSTKRRSTTTETGTKATRKRPPILTVEPLRGSGDALRVQIGIRYRVPAGRQPSSALLNEAVSYRIENGDDHPLFETRIIRWQNPGRKTREGRQWRQGNQPDAWATLGPAIQAAIGR